MSTEAAPRAGSTKLQDIVTERRYRLAGHIDGQFAFSGVLSQNFLLSLILYVLFGFVTK